MRDELFLLVNRRCDLALKIISKPKRKSIALVCSFNKMIGAQVLYHGHTVELRVP